jgi:hypothetical protein
LSAVYAVAFGNLNNTQFQVSFLRMPICALSHFLTAILSVVILCVLKLIVSMPNVVMLSVIAPELFVAAAVRARA